MGSEGFQFRLRIWQRVFHRSGAWFGKSMLVGLLARLYKLSRRQILMNQNVLSFGRPTWVKQVAADP